MSDRPVVRFLVADHQLPSVLSAGHVEVRRIAMGPGVAAGAHEHNGPVFGVIEAGSVEFQIDDDQTVMLRAGDTFYEPGGMRISRFDATEEGAEFLAWFPLPAGQSGVMAPVTDPMFRSATHQASRVDGMQFLR